MVGVSASVNLPFHYKVQKFSSGTGSPRWSWKKNHKMIVVWCGDIEAWKRCHTAAKGYLQIMSVVVRVAANE